MTRCRCLRHAASTLNRLHSPHTPRNCNAAYRHRNLDASQFRATGGRVPEARRDSDGCAVTESSLSGSDYRPVDRVGVKTNTTDGANMSSPSPTAATTDTRTRVYSGCDGQRIGNPSTNERFETSVLSVSRRAEIMSSINGLHVSTVDVRSMRSYACRALSAPRHGTPATPMGVRGTR